VAVMTAAPVRRVGAVIELDAIAATDFVIAVSVAAGQPVASERIAVTVDGRPTPARERAAEHGTRLLAFETGAGLVRIDYAAELVGRAAPAGVDPLDPVVYLRPSRYVQADVLTPFARRTFPGLAGAALVGAVGDWVHERLSYRPEASSPTDGAVETLEAGAGVCRDYAHLTAALLRALDVPARIVSVYAPQLEPMDFHAVVEALVDGRWLLVDATRLAPRTGMVRIATGRDAADVAFVTNTRADVELRRLEVTAHGDGSASEDPTALLDLG